MSDMHIYYIAFLCFLLLIIMLRFLFKHDQGINKIHEVIRVGVRDDEILVVKVTHNDVERMEKLLKLLNNMLDTRQVVVTSDDVKFYTLSSEPGQRVINFEL